MLLEKISDLIENHKTLKHVMDVIKDGEESVDVEKAYAISVIKADVNNDEYDRRLGQQKYMYAARKTDTVANELFNLGLSATDIATIQNRMIKSKKCKSNDFSTQITSKKIATEDAYKLNSTVSGEYYTILYNLVVSMLQKEKFSDKEKNKIYDSVAKKIVSSSLATRFYLCGDLEKANVLSTPELAFVYGSTQIKRAVENFGFNFVKDLNKSFDGSSFIALSTLFGKDYFDDELIPEKIMLVALNIQRIKHGIEPLEPNRKDITPVVEIYDWAKEKAQQYSNVKKRVLTDN